MPLLAPQLRSAELVARVAVPTLLLFNANSSLVEVDSALRDAPPTNLAIRTHNIHQSPPSAPPNWGAARGLYTLIVRRVVSVRCRSLERTYLYGDVAPTASALVRRICQEACFARNYFRIDKTRPPCCSEERRVEVLQLRWHAHVGVSHTTLNVTEAPSKWSCAGPHHLWLVWCKALVSDIATVLTVLRRHLGVVERALHPMYATLALLFCGIEACLYDLEIGWEWP